MTETIIEVTDVKTRLGTTWVHKGVNMTVKRGEIMAIVGGSGSGKTTLLREMLAITKPKSGNIKVFGQDLFKMSPEKLLEIQKRWGVLFQQNALFSSLNLLENVSFPMIEHTDLSADMIRRLAMLKIKMVGLDEEAALKYPSELSGGMQKRAGLARAIALDPELLFLDEPTSGLDPETAAGLDALISNLQSTMGLTIVMVTHDVDSLWTVADRVAFLGDGLALGVDTMPTLVNDPNPTIQAFFKGPRGRVAEQSHQHESDDHGN